MVRLHLHDVKLTVQAEDIGQAWERVRSILSHCETWTGNVYTLTDDVDYKILAFGKVSELDKVNS